MKQEKLSGWLSAVKRLARPLAIAAVVGVAITGVGVTPAYANTFVGLVTSSHTLHVQHPAVRSVQNMTNAVGGVVEVVTTSREATYRKPTTRVNGVQQYSYVCRDITVVQTRAIRGQVNGLAVSTLDRILDGVSHGVVRDYPTTRNMQQTYDATTNAFGNTNDYAGTCSNNVDVWNRDGRALWGSDAQRNVAAASAEILVANLGGLLAGFVLGFTFGITGGWMLALSACVGGAISYSVMGKIQGAMNTAADTAWYVAGGCVNGAMSLFGGNAATNAAKAGLALKTSMNAAAATVASSAMSVGSLSVGAASEGTLVGIELTANQLVGYRR